MVMTKSFAVQMILFITGTAVGMVGILGKDVSSVVMGLSCYAAAVVEAVYGLDEDQGGAS